MGSADQRIVDHDRAAWHAKQAESFLDQAGGLPEQLMLAFVGRAAAHAALAAYLELRRVRRAEL